MQDKVGKKSTTQIALMFSVLQNMMYSSIHLGELPFAIECFLFSENIANSFFLHTDEILLDLAVRRKELIDEVVGWSLV